MAISDEILAGLDDGVLHAIADRLRLTPGQVKSTLANALPTLLDGLQAGTRDAGGAAALARALPAHAGADPFADLAALTSGALGRGIVDKVFGDTLTDVARSLGERSKVSTADADRLLAVAAPAVLTFLAGRLAGDGAPEPAAVRAQVRAANAQARHEMPDLNTIMGGLFGRH